MISKKEIWKAIPNTRHLISSLGRIKQAPGFWGDKELILKGKIRKGGYVEQALKINGKVKYSLVHCLVMQVFVRDKKFGEEVNHKDCNKQNNALENLEYVSKKKNAEHARAMKRYKRGEKHYRAKLTESQAKQLRVLWENTRMPFRKLGKLFNISGSTAHKIVRKEKYGAYIRI